MSNLCSTILSQNFIVCTDLNTSFVLLYRYWSTFPPQMLRILLKRFVNHPTPTSPKHLKDSMGISLGPTAFSAFILLNVSFTLIILILQTNLRFYPQLIPNSLQFLVWLKNFIKITLPSFFTNTLWPWSLMHLTQFKSFAFIPLVLARL